MIISIAHQKGGVGKSTIAFNLAHYLAKYNPVLIDLDMQNTISYANKIRSQTATPFVVTTITSDNELKQIIKLSNKSNLYIIDTGGFDSSWNRLSMIAANVIITPVSDQLFELLGLKKFEGILSELSHIKGIVIQAQILLNNIPPTTKKLNDLHQFIKNSSHFQLMNAILRQRADIVHASAKGLTLAEYNHKSKAHAEMLNLANEICRIIYS